MNIKIQILKKIKGHLFFFVYSSIKSPKFAAENKINYHYENLLFFIIYEHPVIKCDSTK